MKIDITIDLFEGLQSRTDKKTELRVYTKFLILLNGLKNKHLEKEQLLLIESELEGLRPPHDIENKKRFYKKKLNSLNKYLQKEFGYVGDGYYKALYMSLGMSFGVAIGASFDLSNGIAIGMVFGMALGTLLGQAKDKEAEKNGLVLK